MTYTLQDFDLQKGDEVKMVSAVSVWYEFDHRFITMHGDFKYCFFEGAVCEEDEQVLAVLRPSIIMREKLDDILVCVRDCAEFKILPNPEVLIFNEIHPRKPKEEPKKSLVSEWKEICPQAEQYQDNRMISLACLIQDKLEALEKKLECKCKQS